MANQREDAAMTRSALILAHANSLDAVTGSSTEGSLMHYKLEGWNRQFGGLRRFESVRRRLWRQQKGCPTKRDCPGTNAARKATPDAFWDYLHIQLLCLSGLRKWPNGPKAVARVAARKVVRHIGGCDSPKLRKTRNKIHGRCCAVLRCLCTSSISTTFLVLASDSYSTCSRDFISTTT